MAERYRLTFVCMGNICRSPTADGVMRHMVAARNWQHWIAVDSAGTHAHHVGEAPDRRSQQHAQRHKLKRLTEFCTQHDSPVVPDPYFSGVQGFEQVLDLVEDACEGLLTHIAGLPKNPGAESR
jgi:protein-tyrosine phosphatase